MAKSHVGEAVAMVHARPCRGSFSQQLLKDLPYGGVLVPSHVCSWAWGGGVVHTQAFPMGHLHLTLFPAFSLRHRQSREVTQLSNGEVTAVVKKWAKRIGHDLKLYSAIPFRHNSVPMGTAEKVDREVRQHYGRWQSSDMQDLYTRDSKDNHRAVGVAIQRRMLRYAESRAKTMSVLVRLCTLGARRVFWFWFWRGTGAIVVAIWCMKKAQ